MTTLNTGKIENWDLCQLRDYLNINSKDFKLLMEAYRRKNLLDEKPKSIHDTMLGTGNPHQYKSKFFSVKGGVAQAKVNNWYGLSKSGKEILNEIEKIMPIPTETTVKNKLNRILFTF